MNSSELEEAFSEFIDGEVYDKTETALFEVIRAAFLAGWDAAKRDNIKLVKE